MLLLATISNYSAEEQSRMSLEILLLAALIPAAILIFAGAFHPFMIALCVAQMAGFFFSMRALWRCIRRRGYTEIAASSVLCVAYFPLCLATNAAFVGCFLLGMKSI